MLNNSFLQQKLNSFQTNSYSLSIPLTIPRNSQSKLSESLANNQSLSDSNNIHIQNSQALNHKTIRKDHDFIEQDFVKEHSESGQFDLEEEQQVSRCRSGHENMNLYGNSSQQKRRQIKKSIINRNAFNIGIYNYQMLEEVPSEINKQKITQRILQNKNISLSKINQLQKLQLSYNYIHQISSLAFQQLHYLKELILTSNLIVQLPSRNINSCKYLKIIKASNNKIITIPYLANVTVLELFTNPIKLVTSNLKEMAENSLIYACFDWIQLLISQEFTKNNYQINKNKASLGSIGGHLNFSKQKIQPQKLNNSKNDEISDENKYIQNFNQLKDQILYNINYEVEANKTFCDFNVYFQIRVQNERKFFENQIKKNMIQKNNTQLTTKKPSIEYKLIQKLLYKAIIQNNQFFINYLRGYHSEINYATMHHCHNSHHQSSNKLMLEYAFQCENNAAIQLFKIRKLNYIPAQAHSEQISHINQKQSKGKKTQLIRVKNGFSDEKSKSTYQQSLKLACKYSHYGMFSFLMAIQYKQQVLERNGIYQILMKEILETFNVEKGSQKILKDLLKHMLKTNVERHEYAKGIAAKNLNTNANIHQNKYKNIDKIKIELPGSLHNGTNHSFNHKVYKCISNAILFILNDDDLKEHFIFEQNYHRNSQQISSMPSQQIFLLKESSQEKHHENHISSCFNPTLNNALCCPLSFAMKSRNQKLVYKLLTMNAYDVFQKNQYGSTCKFVVGSTQISRKIVWKREKQILKHHFTQSNLVQLVDIQNGKSIEKGKYIRQMSGICQKQSSFKYEIKDKQQNFSTLNNKVHVFDLKRLYQKYYQEQKLKDALSNLLQCFKNVNFSIILEEESMLPVILFDQNLDKQKISEEYFNPIKQEYFKHSKKQEYLHHPESIQIKKSTKRKKIDLKIYEEEERQNQLKRTRSIVQKNSKNKEYLERDSEEIIFLKRIFKNINRFLYKKRYNILMMNLNAGFWLLKNIERNLTKWNALPNIKSLKQVHSSQELDLSEQEIQFSKREPKPFLKISKLQPCSLIINQQKYEEQLKIIFEKQIQHQSPSNILCYELYQSHELLLSSNNIELNNKNRLQIRQNNPSWRSNRGNNKEISKYQYRSNVGETNEMVEVFCRFNCCENVIDRAAYS